VTTAEEFIYPAFRGQGLAAPMQRAFVDELAARGFATDAGCVIGWIHHINEASRRTALKVGRQELGRQILIRP
jgi:RimJ/RimL family protein N-acetyltransferase